MRDVLERAANLMVTSLCSHELRLMGECFQCESDVNVEVNSRVNVMPWVLDLFNEEFPEYKFMFDGADKIIVIKL